MRSPVIVVGAGLIGSAAAKYLCRADRDVLLVGPDEPKAEDYASCEVFGGWFDEGRITRQLDIDPVWGHLASESIARYDTIIKESGINFHRANGFLVVGPENSAFVEGNLQVAKERNVPVEILHGADEISARFPFFNPVSSHPKLTGVLERGAAGSVNPRRLVGAQQKLAADAGARRIRDLVTQVEKVRLGLYRVHTRGSGSFETDAVLVCPGAFLHNQSLFPPTISKPDIKVMKSMVVRIPVESSRSLFRLWDPARPMPSLMAELERDGRAAKPGYHRHPRFFWAMAPIPYPDGGNGYAAKSSDEIGRLAARLVAGLAWDSQLSKDTFRAPKPHL